MNSTVAACRSTGLGELHRRRLLQQQHRRADPQREDQQPAQAEGEGQRRGAGEDVVRRGPAPGAPPKVSAMASTSRWKCMVTFGTPVVPEVGGQQRDVVGGRVDVRERPRLARPARGRRSSAPPPPKVSTVSPADRRQVGRRTGASQSATALRVSSTSWLQLPGAQQRHRGDGDAAGLEDRRTSRPPATGCWAPRSSTRLPGHQPEVLDEHVRDLVGPGEQLAVASRSPGRCAGRGGRARAGRRRRRAAATAQFSRSGYRSSGQVEEQLGPLRRPAAGCPGRTCRHVPTARAARLDPNPRRRPQCAPLVTTVKETE